MDPINKIGGSVILLALDLSNVQERERLQEIFNIITGSAPDSSNYFLPPVQVIQTQQFQHYPSPMSQVQNNRASIPQMPDCQSEWYPQDMHQTDQPQFSSEAAVLPTQQFHHYPSPMSQVKYNSASVPQMPDYQSEWYPQDMHQTDQTQFSSEAAMLPTQQFHHYPSPMSQVKYNSASVPQMPDYQPEWYPQDMHQTDQTQFSSVAAVLPTQIPYNINEQAFVPRCSSQTSSVYDSYPNTKALQQTQPQFNIKKTVPLKAETIPTERNNRSKKNSLKRGYEQVGEYKFHYVDPRKKRKVNRIKQSTQSASVTLPNGEIYEYKYFRNKYGCKIYYNYIDEENTDARIVYTNGTVESGIYKDDKFIPLELIDNQQTS